MTITTFRPHAADRSRRHLLRCSAAALAAGLAGRTAWAHHGWSRFDTGRPLYLEGIARRVAWRNPHVELDLERPAEPQLPADLAQRALPAQTAPVDGPRLLAAAQLPRRNDQVWHVELAPVARMSAWQVAELRDGDRLAVLGYTFTEERGEALLRAEFLFVGPKTYGLRSSPV